jgi:hypothetical protein
MRVEIERLEHHPCLRDALAHMGILAEEKDSALLNRLEPVDAAEQRALA